MVRSPVTTPPLSWITITMDLLNRLHCTNNAFEFEDEIPLVSRCCDAFFFFLTTKINQHCIFQRYQKTFFFLLIVGLVFCSTGLSQPKRFYNIEMVINSLPQQEVSRSFVSQRFANNGDWLTFGFMQASMAFISFILGGGVVMRRYMNQRRHYYIYTTSR